MAAKIGSTFQPSIKDVHFASMGISAFNLDLETFKLIAFAMEDISKPSLFDTKTKAILQSDEISDSSVPLPPWTSQDGFACMEKFVQNLKNPQLKHNLRAVLQAGRGVFKEFKNELKSHPLFEKQWFNFKGAELKRRIIAWHKDIHDEIGFEAVSALGDNETNDEILFDLDIKVLEISQWPSIKSALGQLISISAAKTPLLHFLYNNLVHKAGLELLGGHGVYDNDHNLIGIICSLSDPEIKGTALLLLFVSEDFRGLGIGKLLLKKSEKIFNDPSINQFFSIDEMSHDFIYDFLVENYQNSPESRTFTIRSFPNYYTRNQI